MKLLQHLQMQRINQHQLCDNNCNALEIDCLPTLIFQMVDPQHPWIHHLRELRKGPFEGCKKWRIIQRPFRSLLIIPFLYRQTIRDSQPIPMDFEVCRFAVLGLACRAQLRGQVTCYAGNSSTLSAVVTTAHCVIEGYKSAIETFPTGLCCWSCCDF